MTFFSRKLPHVPDRCAVAHSCSTRGNHAKIGSAAAQGGGGNFFLAHTCVPQRVEKKSQVQRELPFESGNQAFFLQACFFAGSSCSTQFGQRRHVVGDRTCFRQQRPKRVQLQPRKSSALGEWCCPAESSWRCCGAAEGQVCVQHGTNGIDIRASRALMISALRSRFYTTHDPELGSFLVWACASTHRDVDIGARNPEQAATGPLSQESHSTAPGSVAVALVISPVFCCNCFCLAFPG